MACGYLITLALTAACALGSMSQVSSVISGGTSITSFSSSGGEPTIIINGQKLDLNSSRVIEKTNEYTKYQPEGMPNTVITRYANGGYSVVSRDGGVSIQNRLSPEEEKRIVDSVTQSMSKLQEDMRRMGETLNSQFSNMFRGWPFQGR